jgi:hypothetical protein
MKEYYEGSGEVRSHTRLRWKMAPKLDSGIISGVGIWPLSMPFQFYLVLFGQRMFILQLSWTFLEVLRLGGGCLCLVLQDVVFSQNEMGMKRQLVVGPFQKMVVWC